MPKIVGYYGSPYGALGDTPIADLLGLNRLTQQALASALPVIEQKIDEKLKIAAIGAGVGFVSLAALIWATRSR